MHSSRTLSLYTVLMLSSCTQSLYSLDALAHSASTQLWCTHHSQTAPHGMTDLTCSLCTVLVRSSHTWSLYSLGALISHTEPLQSSWTHFAHRASTVFMHSFRTQSLYSLHALISHTEPLQSWCTRTQSLCRLDALILHTEPLQSWCTHLAHWASTQSWCTHLAHRASTVLMHSSRTQSLYSLDALISHTEPLQSWCTHFAHRTSTVLMHSSRTQSLYTILMYSLQPTAPHGVTDPTQNLYSLDTLISHTEPVHNLDVLPAPHGVTLIPHRTSTVLIHSSRTQSLYTILMHSLQPTAPHGVTLIPHRASTQKSWCFAVTWPADVACNLSVVCHQCLWNVTYVCGASAMNVVWHLCQWQP